MTFTIRPATLADTGDVDALLQRSYPRLLRASYPPSVLVTALPRMTRAQPALLQSGTYYVAEENGDVLGAGGWTAAIPGCKTAEPARGNIRHVVTHHRALRRGVARALLEHSFAAARAAGLNWMHCMATRNAVPFYAAMGFDELGPIVVPLGPGIAFPSVEMRRDL